MADTNYEKKYTDPDLRRQLKDKIKKSDKGGKPGQWSARKSQLLVQEYEKRGGGYKKNKKDKAARSLEEWTAQNWQTKEGSARAAAADSMKRYLPEAAWALLLDSDRKEAERTKKKTDEKGEQQASWPKIVQRVMTEIGAIEGSQGLTKSYLANRAKELDIEGRSNMNKEDLKKAIIDEYPRKGEPDGRTKAELYQRAQELDIEGRSKMDKKELAAAVQKAKS